MFTIQTFPPLQELQQLSQAQPLDYYYYYCILVLQYKTTELHWMWLIKQTSPQSALAQAYTKIVISTLYCNVHVVILYYQKHMYT